MVKNKAGHVEKVKVDEREAAAGEVDRPSKLIGKIRKSFEDIKAPVSRKVAAEEDVIRPNLVKEMRKSFENMPFPDPPSEQELRESCSNSVAGEDVGSAAPVTPPRSSSFHKAGGSRLSFGKTSPQSKSTSSIADNNDEGYSTFPNSPRKPGRPNTYLEKVASLYCTMYMSKVLNCQKYFKRGSFFFKLLTVQTRYVVHMTSCIVVLLQAYIPEKSISYVDLTDTEQNSIDDAFGTMHEKVHTST